MKILPATSPSLLALLLAATPALAADPAPAPTTGAMHPGMHQGMNQGMGPHHDMATGMGKMRTLNADHLNWGPAPAVLPKGAQLAVLDGDPHQAAPYVIRLKMPPGYQIPPHWHSKAESLTIVAGTLSLGMGDTPDRKAAQELTAGGFHAIGAQVHHYAFSRTGAVVQIHGEGPFDIHYINPADNPAPATKP